MSSVKAVEVVDLYFRSGNDIPVQRANVSKEEWEAVKEYIEELEAGVIFTRQLLMDKYPLR